MSAIGQRRQQRGRGPDTRPLLVRLPPGDTLARLPGLRGDRGGCLAASDWSKLLAKPSHWSVRAAVFSPSQELDNTIIVRHRRRDNTLGWLANFNKTGTIQSSARDGYPFVLNKMPKNVMVDVDFVLKFVN